MTPRAGSGFLLFLLCSAWNLRGETGYAAWLRYQPVNEPSARALYDRLPATVVALGDSQMVETAQKEIIRGVRGMLGRTLRSATKLPPEDAIVLAALASVKQVFLQRIMSGDLIPDGFLLKTTTFRGHNILLIVGQNDRGVLYGAFTLLRKMSLGDRIDTLDEIQHPYAPVRWVNQWDNLDGSIERGYAGRSIFFENANVVPDLIRAADYARLLASIGINGCTVNNVNASPRMLESDFLPQLARIADAFRPWGVALSLSVDFTSPKTLGGLDTFDPLDPRVAKWWRAKVDEIYRLIPDLGGFVLKADSEGRAGPSVYSRTHADAANVLAQALKPHGGIVVYRAFVYNHSLDWRDLKNDRARAAYDNFHPLDGKFKSNAIVQIK